VVPQPDTVITVPAGDSVPWAGMVMALVLASKLKLGLTLHKEMSFSLVLPFQAAVLISSTVWVDPGSLCLRVPATTR
jgi:hypothetical protein